VRLILRNSLLGCDLTTLIYRETAERIQKEKERISTTSFSLWHFSPGDKIENCPAQFLAVCWIVRVELSAKPVGVGAVSRPSILAGDAEKYNSDAGA
jgi:hypothetical protein